MLGNAFSVRGYGEASMTLHGAHCWCEDEDDDDEEEEAFVLRHQPHSCSRAEAAHLLSSLGALIAGGHYLNHPPPPLDSGAKFGCDNDEGERLKGTNGGREGEGSSEGGRRGGAMRLN